MPIRINLLAEAQAAEERRRKDPVKRALLGAALAVLGMGIWISTLQFKIIIARSDQAGLETRWKAIEKTYQTASDCRRQADEIEQKIQALDAYTTNRFLWGTALNAFQQTLNGVDDIQVLRFKTEQNYLLTEGTKARTNGNRVTPGQPATAREKVALTIDALDSSVQLQGSVHRYKEAIAIVPYFQERLQKTNGVLLTSLSAPQTGSLHRQPYVLFTLQCSFPEKVR